MIVLVASGPRQKTARRHLVGYCPKVRNRLALLGVGVMLVACQQALAEDSSCLGDLGPLIHVSCDAPNGITATIEATLQASDPVQIFSGDDGLLSILDAGSFMPAAGTALWVFASELEYLSIEGSIHNPEGGGIEAATFAGDLTLDVTKSITANTGIKAGTHVWDGSSPRTSVLFRSGKILATGAGIAILNGGDGDAHLLIGESAEIEAPTGFSIQATSAHVTLAGKLIGDNQYSSLTYGDDTLELHPGYELEGQIDGLTGMNTLALAGNGTAVLGLGSIGSSFDPGLNDRTFLDFTHLAKRGSSRWTLEGIASGPLDVTVEEGDLRVLGQLPASGLVTVESDAMVSGTGRAGTVDLHGTLSPGGEEIGTFYAEHVIFHPGSILRMDLGHGVSDLLDVGSASGPAEDDAPVSLLLVPSAGVAGSYRLLQSESLLDLAGRFDVQPSSLVHRVTLRFESNEVWADLERSGALADYAQSAAQAVVARELDILGEAGPNYLTLIGLTPQDAASTFEQMAGAGHASTGAAAMQSAGLLGTAALGRAQQVPVDGSPLGYAADTFDSSISPGGPTIWGRVLAGTSTTTGGSASSASLIAGADIGLDQTWTLGILAGVGTSSSQAGGTTVASADLSAGFYGAGDFGLVDLRFGGSLTHHASDSRRRIAAPGIAETLSASYGALTAQAFSELAVGFDLGAVTAELFGGVSYAHHVRQGFVETGGPSALSVSPATTGATETTLGARVNRKVAFETILADFGLSLAWRHKFADAPRTMNSFVGGTPFEVAGQSTAGSSIAATANVLLDFDGHRTIELAYGIDHGSPGTTHQFTARYAGRL